MLLALHLVRHSFFHKNKNKIQIKSEVVALLVINPTKSRTREILEIAGSMTVEHNSAMQTFKIYNLSLFATIFLTRITISITKTQILLNAIIFSLETYEKRSSLQVLL